MRKPNLEQPLPKSRAGADRQYAAIYRYYKWTQRGGLAFGMDSRTMASNWPEGYARMVVLERLAPTLPEFPS